MNAQRHASQRHAGQAADAQLVSQLAVRRLVVAAALAVRREEVFVGGSSLRGLPPLRGKYHCI